MQRKDNVKDDTAQEKKFSVKDFFSKYDQIRRKLRIWSYLLKKFLTETSFFVQCDIRKVTYNNQRDYDYLLGKF